MKPKIQKPKNDLRQKNITLWCGNLWAISDVKISEVFEFSIWPYEQNWKLENLGKFSFALSFDSFDCI